MFSKITLVIPTHYRHHYLIRVLNYYKNVNLRILVADSSKSQYYVRSFPNVNYFHYPNYQMFQKLADVIKKVETPYVFMCGDDDFIIPSALVKCINFLEKNLDYSSAQGQYVSFKNRKRNIFFHNSLHHIMNKRYDINAKTPEDRMKQNMSCYMHLFYSVQRTETLKQLFSLSDGLNRTNNGNLRELALALVSVINGKHRLLPFYYCARERNAASSGKTTEKIEDIQKNPEMKEHYDVFVMAVSKHLSNQYMYNIEDSKRLVVEAITCYVNIFLPFYLNKSKPTDLKTTKFNIFYNTILNIISILSPRIHNIITKKTIYFKFENSSSPYYEDFKEIRNLIKKHSKAIQKGNKTPKTILKKVYDLKDLIIILVRILLRKD